MDELASLAVRAAAFGVEVLAHFGLVPTSHVLFLLKLVFSVSKCTILTEIASSSPEPRLAELCLNLDLIILRNYPTCVFKCEWILGFLDRLRVERWSQRSCAFYLLFYSANSVVKGGVLRLFLWSVK